MSETPYGQTRNAAFWQGIYDDGDAGWDLGGPNPSLPAALNLGLLRERRRILVPGCGRGYDAVLLASRGHDVVAVDFARTAVEDTARLADETGVTLAARELDIFALESEPAGSFDGLYEYTCYCAIDPELRDRYVDLMAHLLRPGGRILMNAFPLGPRDDGPPHPIFIDQLRERFSRQFDWLLDTKSFVAPEPRRERERLVLMQRR